MSLLLMYCLPAIVVFTMLADARPRSVKGATLAAAAWPLTLALFFSRR